MGSRGADGISILGAIITHFREKKVVRESR